MPERSGVGSIWKRGGRYWIAYHSNGRRYRESARSHRKADAEALLRQRLAEIESGTFAGSRAQRTTVAELLDALLSDYERNGKALAWAKILDGHLRPVFGAERAARITTQHLQRYIDQRRAAGIANKTINLELGFLRRAFNLGASSQPPRCKPLPKVPSLKPAPPRSGFFEHAEYLAMREALPAHLKPLLTFGYYTGCRRGEILGLRWNQVDLEARTVRLNPGETKSGEGRVIPLAGELLATLQRQRAERDGRWPSCAFVFHRYGKQIRSIKDAWHEAAKRAGLWDAERERPSRLFHDLRRTGVRNLVRAGVPERVAMMISGHKTRAVFDRYNIVSERDLHNAAAALERHIAGMGDSATPQKRHSRRNSRKGPDSGPS